MVSKIEPGWQPKILKRGRAQGLAMNFSDFARENADNSPPQDRKAARRRLYRAGGRVVVWSVALFGKRDEEDAEGHDGAGIHRRRGRRSEEHTSELQSLMRISYAVFCLKKQTR